MTPTGQFTLHDAAEKILEEKGLHFPDQEIKEEAITDIVQRINDRIDSEVLESLSEKQREQFDQLISRKATPHDVQEFIATHIKNISQIISSAIIDIRNLYLSQ
ncbi:MAG: hypothetical protein KBD29_03790 [Candidatus Magasanikbacteria bacterium]|nr:hypothetical protein [Candidatus Magasanikbacteria bacterium]